MSKNISFQKKSCYVKNSFNFYPGSFMTVIHFVRSPVQQGLQIPSVEISNRTVGRGEKLNG